MARKRKHPEERRATRENDGWPLFLYRQQEEKKIKESPHDPRIMDSRMARFAQQNIVSTVFIEISLQRAILSTIRFQTTTRSLVFIFASRIFIPSIWDPFSLIRMGSTTWTVDGKGTNCIFSICAKKKNKIIASIFSFARLTRTKLGLVNICRASIHLQCIYISLTFCHTSKADLTTTNRKMFALHHWKAKKKIWDRTIFVSRSTTFRRPLKVLFVRISLTVAIRRECLTCL